MRISWNWLSTLITGTDLQPQAAADILTSTGLEVESVTPLEPVKGMLAGVVVGQVKTCVKHPDADRLRVCTVDVGGSDLLNIVCGAPNVAEGQKVLVATVGATLHPLSGEPLTIKRSKIRGVESQGMICAEDELGLGESHAGILVLADGAEIGTAASVQLGLRGDHVLEIGLTPNRADALGHIGVARDLVAALNVRTGAKALVQWPSVEKFAPRKEKGIAVEVLDTTGCPRYAGLTLQHVRVGASPAWLQERLKSIGLKPINNVVDATNFVQHELGQPLHAFDADRLAGGRIVVRRAKAEEAFTTLERVERKLHTEDLVIADAEKPACLAGVFGGAHSGVTEATTTVFLESACFDATVVRRTARRHGLNTDASFRFERGVDPERTVYALQRAALLLKEVANAEVASGVTDIRNTTAPWKRVVLTYGRINTLIGAPIPPAEVQQVLAALDFRTVEENETGLTVEVPPYRVDVSREADVIEEIIRIVGFDRVPMPERLMVPAVQRAPETLEGLQQRMAQHLAARGFREAMTPSLVNGERMQRLASMPEGELVRLRNPLSAELDVLRPTLLPGLLQAAAHNMARQQRDLRLFEKGRIYRLADERTNEEERTALLISGATTRESWRTPQRRTDWTDAQAEIKLLLTRMGIDRTEQRPVSSQLFSNAWEVLVGGKSIALSGEVAPAVARAFGVDQPTMYAEVYDEVCLASLRTRRTTYQEVPKFPHVRRDLSLLLDSQVTFAQLEHAARQSERKLLRAVDLFDVYEGDKLPAGKKSYALSFILQDAEKTLTDEQVEKAMGRIRASLEKETGAELRG